MNPTGTRSLLVPVDGCDPVAAEAAVAEAVAIYRQEPVAIHLLNVQPMLSGHVAMFFQDAELQQIQQQAGIEELAAARAQLQAAGVPCTYRVVTGRGAETIARIASNLSCDRILLAQGHGGIASKMFGSLAQQVRHVLAGGDCQVIGS